MNAFTLAHQTCKLWNIIEPIVVIDGQDVLLLQLDVKWRIIVINKHSCMLLVMAPALFRAWLILYLGVIIFFLVQNCHLHSVAKTFGSLTAQKRNETHMNTGFSFVDATITGSGPIYLGRAWGNYSRTVYSYSWMDNIVYPPGWSDFGFADRQT